MRIFIDSATPPAVEKALLTGLVDGITTNPTLIARAKRPRDTIIKELCALTSLPISAEVHATEKEAIIEEGLQLQEIGPQVVIKVPLTPDGLQACQVLRSKGSNVNVTLCFSPLQGLLAARAGATYVSPFVGRLDHIGHSGMGLVEQLVTIINRASFSTKTSVLVSSVRSMKHIVQAALLGAHYITVTPETFWSMMEHPLTEHGLKEFLQDATKPYIE